ncbi:hypothetical protein BPOR_0067g00270 [Botrytis porri]|uniref:Uncharacterized protein n=1 Tax=Botrytis porri TaxID=87229 RepID=A0A4Z1L0N6_9HELO|nr:hypothetical protein BPOR_0067g00270 [Botrytis porri]
MDPNNSTTPEVDPKIHEKKKKLGYRVIRYTGPVAPLAGTEQKTGMLVIQTLQPYTDLCYHTDSEKPAG